LQRLRGRRVHGVFEGLRGGQEDAMGKEVRDKVHVCNA
jgi:hypothetical protein